MRPATLRNAAVLVFVTLVSGFADSVTTLDHLSVNGVLTKMSGGAITLEARFASGSKTLTIPMSTVETIEFNSVAFNPGAPPKAYGLGPGLSPSPHAPAPAPPPVVTDAVELRGGNGERQPCKVASIDEGVVHCEAAPSGKDKGKQTEYPRRIVLRILVGEGR